LSFGDLLRHLRLGKSLTQEELAQRVGISKAYVSALEVGRRTAPPYAIVQAIAEGLDCDVTSLWTAARGERAEHLAERISGTPASRRLKRGPEQAGHAGDVDEASIETIAEAIGRDGENRRDLANLLRRIAALLDANDSE